MKRFILSVVILFASQQLWSQENVKTATLIGKVSDMTTGEPILIGSLTLYKNDMLISETNTDFDGLYYFANLEPGLFDVEVSYVGYKSEKIIDVALESGELKIINLKIRESPYCGGYIVKYKVPLIDFENTTSGIVFTSDLIEKLPVK